MRLTSKADFNSVFRYKCCVNNGLMRLYIAPNQTDKPRFAASISSKTAPAHLRNRLKRLAKEVFRLNQDKIRPGFDYLVIYSAMLSKRQISDIKKLSLNDIEQSFLDLAEKGYKLFEKRPK